MWSVGLHMFKEKAQPDMLSQNHMMSNKARVIHGSAGLGPIHAQFTVSWNRAVVSDSLVLCLMGRGMGPSVFKEPSSSDVFRANVHVHHEGHIYGFPFLHMNIPLL